MKNQVKVLMVLVLLLMIGIVATPRVMAETGDTDKPIVSVTPYLGWGLWDQDLGVDDSLVYGGRAAFHFLPWLGIEGTYGRSATDHTATGSGVDLDHYGVDLFADLLPSARVVPYLTAGWAQFGYTPDGSDTSVPLNGGEFGAGIKAKLGGDNASYRALRLEIRDVMTDLNGDFPNDGGWTHNLIGSVGMQFAFGKSSKDSDNDGVRDRSDACADTPVGATVDQAGCPRDSDNDGVLDGIDQCPDTPAGATVDLAGCPRDSDSDGVYDGIDLCPDTKAGATVDLTGCPRDSDSDGVLDGIDQCPDTKANLQVDQAGCPIAVTEVEVQLLDKGAITTRDIVFDTSSATLARESVAVLQEIGETLTRWPALRIEIGGHTDSSGSAAFNQKLSEQRAQSVLDYLLVSFPGITAGQYSVKGYGEAEPVADNDTTEGRAANRRVEFKVLNTEDLKLEIEKRKLLER